MNTISLKTELLNYCRNQVDTRFAKIKHTISGIEESLFGESKSSSGDKHETARAMLQIDRENAGRQLREIENLAIILPRINVETVSEYTRLGSLVYTDKFTYFISISVGAVNVDGNQYLCVAINSPVGILLLGKKKGEEFILNGVIQKILEVK